MDEEQTKPKLKQLIDHNYYGICATIIADSKNIYGHRLTSYVWTFPRFILAEVNTHRMLSRNSASSRAIPFKTMVAKVEDNPFISILISPTFFFSNNSFSKSLAILVLALLLSAIYFTSLLLCVFFANVFNISRNSPFMLPPYRIYID